MVYKCFVLYIEIKPVQINNSYSSSCKVSHRGVFITLTKTDDGVLLRKYLTTSKF